MDSRYLQSFVFVVELGSIAEAARRLDLTPAAVAQRVKMLEAELGATLVRRSGRTVGATEAGERILARARAVLHDIRDLRSDIEDTDQLGGQLRLGGMATMMGSLIPDALAVLLGHHPQMDFYLEPGTSLDLYRKVTAGDLDAAVIAQPLFNLPKSCDWHTFRTEPLVLLTPAAMNVNDVHATLLSEPFIRYDRNVVGGQLADAYLRQQGIKPNQRCELDGLAAIATLVDRGLGVSLVPDWAPHEYPGISVRKWALPNAAPKRLVGLLWGRSCARIRLVQAFLGAADSIERTRHGSGKPKQ
ncbi:LysR substrate-binding domain-containing protein [Caballeronia sp. LP006]|jgi:DNA-binding transcriptional LysR family regulator|uniref:LysR substrate-binding domain-containing protein n=1 Tax=unclassified Caballeronia TaxID=2646786 RepID=UPI001FD4A5D9|nr:MULTISPECIES: LysR substrate-binding domain-containing protein [unclassified Caballeronia]MDR5773214.1 LysR substrate-binding domain-containing protein [Caballeronia sp. LZ002]MDR5800193.1 LysR substrate-binding domain-containing protein [Caballeronia sp. LZ001]MDR5827695.1 LysR substrate-binding domain-containing protein [Caballeronia sp. LP006]MDR5848648.1 LysR substrate-binding domain-containing protein [Caballeronia sp. LZ003]